MVCTAWVTDTDTSYGNVYFEYSIMSPNLSDYIGNNSESRTTGAVKTPPFSFTYINQILQTPRIPYIDLPATDTEEYIPNSTSYHCCFKTDLGLHESVLDKDSDEYSITSSDHLCSKSYLSYPFFSPMFIQRPRYYVPPWARSLPNRPPDVAVWNDVAGGNLQWTPHSWVAHPQPHPELPAHQFWGPSFVPWRGPGGQPYHGVNPVPVAWLTGGIPLPGQDPYWSPSTWTPPVTLFPGQVAISPYLAPNPRSTYNPQIIWNVATTPPSRITRMTSKGILEPFSSSKKFKEQATWPEAKKVTVALEGFNMFGPIKIDKKEKVTVADVLDGVYNFLHKQLTHAELHQICKGSGGRDRYNRIYEAFRHRCASSSTLHDYMWNQGLKRVDLLEGKTHYWGAYPGYDPDGSWYICISFIRR